MAIQISGCTVIDNSRNITNANNMCVGVVTMTGSSGDIETPGTITAGGIDFPPNPISFDPADGAVDVDGETSITITFGQRLDKGTGNITIRDGSAAGTILQTIDVTSGSVTVSGAVVTIVPPSSMPSDTSIYVVVDAGAFTSINIDSGNEIINTYNFTIRTLSLGDSYQGGFLICQSGGTRWIVSPSSAGVGANWNNRGIANTCAQSVTGCTGWFIPSCSQLQNPGYVCNVYWDSFSPSFYWSNNAVNPSDAVAVSVLTGQRCPGDLAGISRKTNVRPVRSFRTVSY